MKGLWECWERCTQGTRWFDNFYHEINSLAKQLKGIGPELIFRKLKSATDADVRYKAHEKAAKLDESDYERLADLYALTDEAIRELAKEKKSDSDKKEKEKKGKGNTTTTTTPTPTSTTTKPVTTTTTVATTVQSDGGKKNTTNKSDCVSRGLGQNDTRAKTCGSRKMTGSSRFC